MKILAISGGPDSVFLLEKYKNQNLVLAHVNYQTRKTSIDDQMLVLSYAKKYNLKCEILKVKAKKPKNNFQAWAREIRYNFFIKISQKYKTNLVLLAHHKNDFLESALMQKEKDLFFYGIKKISQYKNLILLRPLIDKYWKTQILDYLERNNIKYNNDYTNDLPLYTRNKLRLELNSYSLSVKEKLYKEILEKNKSLEDDYFKFNNEWTKFEQSNYELELLKNSYYQKQIIYKILKNYFDCKISLNKLNGILQFCFGKIRTGKYLIKKDTYLFKKQNKLSL